LDSPIPRKHKNSATITKDKSGSEKVGVAM
jgi:hypothetical protein